jgi:MFS family permease
MSARDWSELERRLDDAIDALNRERVPDLEQGDDEAQLLDTLRTVRRLREPVEPDAEFEDQLVERTLAWAATTSLVSYPNGSGASQPPAAGLVSRPSMRRYRLMMSQVAAVLRVVGVFVLAGMLSGAIVGGLGGRVAMRISGYLYQRENPGVRIVTESSGEPVGQISLQGTIDLIVQSMGSGVVIGILLLIVAPWLPRSGWRRAVAFGVLLLAVVGATVINPDDHDLRTLGPPLLNIAMFATLIVVAGILATPFVSWLDRAVAANSSRSARIGARVLGAVAIVLGGIALASALLLLVVNGISVPVQAVLDPGISTLVVAPLVLFVLVAVPLTRVAVAFPDHPAALNRLRSPFVTRLITVGLRLATAAGLLFLLINTFRIVSG